MMTHEARSSRVAMLRSCATKRRKAARKAASCVLSIAGLRGMGQGGQPGAAMPEAWRRAAQSVR
eukprot:9021238-Alexandrium_andersonii.AAC.1